MPDKVDSLANCRVLVVEDDEGIHQLLIGHFLDLIGIKDIEFAIDGVEGLEAARRWHPDLIVLDLEMPRMNGLEMLRQLKADFTLADIPVIIETAEESSERREQMFELGATDFVSKPLICKEFQGRVKVHLENRLHVRRLEADLERIQQELRDAATLQRALLPSSARLAEKEKRYGLIIRQVFEPCSQLGGDFWGMIPIDDRRVGARAGLQKNRHERGAGAGASGGGTGLPDARESHEETQRAGSREDGPRAARVRMLGRDTPADLIPGPDRRCAPESEAEKARTWSERLLRAHAGDGAHSMLRTLIADLPRTRTPWEQVLRAQLAHSLAPKPGLSWSRPSRSYIANQGRAGPGRRLPWTPGFSSLKPSPHLVVIVDVSGSIDDGLLDKFAREIEAITRRQEAALVIIVGDDQVRRVAGRTCVTSAS